MKLLSSLLILASLSSYSQIVTNTYQVTQTTTNIVTTTLPFDSDTQAIYNGNTVVNYDYFSPNSSYSRMYRYRDLDLNGKWDFYLYSEIREISFPSRTPIISKLPYKYYFAQHVLVPNLDGKSVSLMVDGILYPSSPTKWITLNQWSYYDIGNTKGVWPGFNPPNINSDIVLIIWNPIINGVKTESSRYRIEWMMQDITDKYSPVILWDYKILPLPNNSVPFLDNNYNLKF